MRKPKVSIIIPVYNVSEYLRRCLDSVVNQTLKDIEIIIINDCSPDPLDDEICNEYTKQDSRIKYIKHKKNLGLGGARNTGIKNATARYIGSVDSDDWVDKNMFEKLYNAATDGDWDVVICGFKRVTPEGDILSETDFSNRSNITEEKNKDIFTISNPAFWNKLWKRDLYIKNKVFFPNHLYYEDLCTTPKVYYYAKKIKYIPGTFYNYLWKRSEQKNSSITFTVSEKNLNDHFEVFQNIKKFLEEKDILWKLKNSFIDMTFSSLIHHITCMSTFLTNEELINYCKNSTKKLIDFHISYYNENIDDLENKTSLILKDIQKVKEENTELNKELVSMTSKLEKEKEENTELNKELASITSKLKKEKEENTELNKELASITSKLKEKEQQIVNLKNSKTFKIGQIITYLPKKIKYSLRNKL
jgi:glycosyltransferase involved in cell wall biosynthesis